MTYQIDLVLSRLNRAISENNPQAVEDAVALAYQVGLTAHFVPALLTLLEMTQHQQHEKIAEALQQLKDPRAVEALGKAALAQHGYLETDNDFALARMCTWALADIGTPPAKAALEELAAGDNTKIAAFATRRIDRWNEEMHRKGI